MMKNVTNNLESAFYEVESEPLRFLDMPNYDIGVFGNRRTDTGEHLGTVSSMYGVTQNFDLVSVAELAFIDAGLENYSASAKIVKNGARAYMEYKFDDEEVKREVIPGDVVGLSLTLVNSFDGRQSRCVRLGLHRFANNSNLIGSDVEFSLEERHIKSKVNLDQNLIMSRVEKAKELIDYTVERFRKLSRMNINTEQVERLFEYMVDKNIIGVRIVEKVKEFWNSPTNSFDHARTLYALFGAFTSYLDSSHSDYANSHYETAQTKKDVVLRFLERLADAPEKLDQLFDPDISDLVKI